MHRDSDEITRRDEDETETRAHGRMSRGKRSRRQEEELVLGRVRSAPSVLSLTCTVTSHFTLTS